MSSSFIFTSVVKECETWFALWSHVPKIEELKAHIKHIILWEYKDNKNATETAKEICSVYDQGVMTDRQVWNWFSKFRSGDASLRNEPRLGRSSDLEQDFSRQFVECNPHKSPRELALDVNISKFTIWCHLKR